jgi:hypothetical protein
MPELPPGVETGVVSWSALSTVVADQSLEGLAGDVVFTLNIDLIPTAFATLFAEPTMMHVEDGTPTFVELIATDSPAFDDIGGLQYRVDLVMSDGDVREPVFIEVRRGVVTDLSSAVVYANPDAVVYVQGPQGVKGDPGGDPGAFVHHQTTPSATWTVPNPFGRLPGVTLYVSGQQVEADVDSTDSAVYVTFPSPYSGTAVLT